MLFFKALKNNSKFSYSHLFKIVILTYEHKMEIHTLKPTYGGFLKDYPVILQILYLNCKKS